MRRPLRVLHCYVINLSPNLATNVVSNLDLSQNLTLNNPLQSHNQAGESAACWPRGAGGYIPPFLVPALHVVMENSAMLERNLEDSNSNLYSFLLNFDLFFRGQLCSSWKEETGIWEKSSYNAHINVILCTFYKLLSQKMLHLRIYRVFFLTPPPPKISKCRPVSKFFRKKLKYPDGPPPLKSLSVGLSPPLPLKFPSVKSLLTGADT